MDSIINLALYYSLNIIFLFLNAQYKITKVSKNKITFIKMICIQIVNDWECYYEENILGYLNDLNILLLLDVSKTYSAIVVRWIFQPFIFKNTLS